MTELFRVNNEKDQKEYFISVYSVKKRFRIRQIKDKVSSAPAVFGNIILKVSIFRESINTKCLLTIYLDDPLNTGFLENDFSVSIKNIIGREKISELTDPDLYYDIFQKYGFVSNLQEIWHVFPITKIKALFLTAHP